MSENASTVTVECPRKPKPTSLVCFVAAFFFLPPKSMFKHLSEPWFSLVYTGKKKVEGRLNKGFFGGVKEGDVVHFFNDDLGFRRTVSVRVLKVVVYASFEELLRSEKRVLPTVRGARKKLLVYRRFYSEDDEREHGVVALRVQRE